MTPPPVSIVIDAIPLLALHHSARAIVSLLGTVASATDADGGVDPRPPPPPPRLVFVLVDSSAVGSAGGPLLPALLAGRGCCDLLLRVAAPLPPGAADRGAAGAASAPPPFATLHVTEFGARVGNAAGDGVVGAGSAGVPFPWACQTSLAASMSLPFLPAQGTARLRAYAQDVSAGGAGGAVVLGPAHGTAPTGGSVAADAAGGPTESSRPGVGDAEGIGEGGREGVRFDAEAIDLDDDLDL